ncbi:hypothetical protein Aspvir_003310 [Aspergillus viridinutans]|uniref:Uncharacterized protein n=1 Tax=Aspergillus viridinutans TaxID=75553 RepID=A0A9P3CCG9_ASPVI|nr:uncharacterized protein Aspvir_003310 [Aspergillus viridinutans]GIK07644.1 hypothetical protein Aspvir_003310 [Aspergillus viridinutans]
MTSLTTTDRSIDQTAEAGFGLYPTTPPTPPIVLSRVISSRRVGEGSSEEDYAKRSLNLSQLHQWYANVSEPIQEGATQDW